MNKFASPLTNCLPVCIAVLLAAPSPNATGQGAEEVNQLAIQDLAGTWQAEKAISSEMEIPDDQVKTTRLTFGKTEIVITRTDQEDKQKSEFKIDATKIPAHIEIRPENEPVLLLGIYKIKNDVLTLRLLEADTDSDRDSVKPPSDFETELGEDMIEITLKRVKDRDRH